MPDAPMGEVPKCFICNRAIFPDENHLQNHKGQRVHDTCWVRVGERAVVYGLDWSPVRRGAQAAQGGLPSLGKRRP